MKKLTFGTPEELVPSTYCDGFNYVETEVKYDISKIRAKENARGYTLLLPLDQNEHIYGFGLQLKRMDFKGHKVTVRTNADPVAPTGDSHAPVPFFVSTAGYGIYFDTARYAEFDFDAKLTGTAKSTSDKIDTTTDALYDTSKVDAERVCAVQIPAAKGIDIYIIEGETITDIVSQYNMLSGGGCDVPQWALEVFYRCNTEWIQSQVIDIADYFREKDIPCTILGLEPGWHKRAYSCSFTWRPWKFPDPDSMIEYLGSKGFHINLWEHAFTHPEAPFYDQIKDKCCDYGVFDGVVPDFGLPEVRKIFADHHRNNVIKGCIDGFKLDECDGSDITGGWSFPNLAEFPSGLDGERYHNLFGTLYAKTIMDALDHRPTLCSIRQAGPLFAQYPFVLYSDLYDHEDFIRGCVTAGFSGLLWTPEVRDARSAEDMKRRLQNIVFSTQCLINAWYCNEAPWLDLGCEDDVREILKIREQVIPYVLKAFKNYKEKGIAPMRALVSDYTNDPETYGIDDQYILGENLIVAPIIAGNKGRKVYLPEGEWVDFFTGEKQECGWFEVETDNIPVYKRVN